MTPEASRHCPARLTPKIVFFSLILRCLLCRDASAAVGEHKRQGQDFSKDIQYALHRHGNLQPARGLQIYVYTVDDVEEIGHLLQCPGKVGAHADGQWGFEVKVHEALLSSELRTMNAEQADFYFLPSYAKCLNDFGVKHIDEINAIFNTIIAKLPFFRRSQGQDHIVVFPSGRGPTLFLDWYKAMPTSIFLVAEPHFTDGQAALAPHYMASRDILVPGHIRPDKLAMLRRARKPMAERQFLAAYKGAVQGKPWRINLGKLAREFPTDIQLEGDYESMMGNARFCLIPRGQSAWTRRTYETFFAECVPIFLSDHVELPFESGVDYSKMTVKWPADRIDASLVGFMRSVSLEDLEKARLYMRRVRCLFDYTRTLDVCSPLAGIAASLEAKRQALRDAPGRFWKLGGSWMDSNLRPISYATPANGTAHMGHAQLVHHGSRN